MNVCLDVDYHKNFAVAACVLFEDWRSGNTCGEITEKVDSVAPYVPGQFYLRELPCLLAVLKKIQIKIETIVIDGFVWLGDQTKPGLGAHLYNALEGQCGVIGVAKNYFVGAGPIIEIFRGSSNRPIFVSSAGVDPRHAAQKVKQMHGPFRIPTLLKRVDQLCRGSQLSSG